jgi:hypothetical protein
MRLRSVSPWACGACLFLSFSCVSEQPEGLRVAKGGSRPIMRPVFAEPILLDQSKYLLIPFWMQTPPKVQSGIDLFSGSGGSGGYSYSGSSGDSISMSKAFGDYMSAGSIHWNNLVFCDKTNGQCHLLLDHKAVICDAYLPNPPDDKKSERPRPLLFGIAEKDTNGDGYINSEDAVVLYAADPDGRNLVRLTPEGTQLSGIVIDGDDTLYVRVLRDFTGDHKPTEGRESLIFQVDLRHPAEGRSVLDEAVRRQAQSIIEAE